MSKEVSKNYHHGNLKEALIKGFLELLQSSNFENISLRKLALHVGVAPTAVYNHFSDKMALRVAVKLVLLDHFTGYLESAALKAGSPSETIRMLGQAYFQYSREYKSYYDFLLNSEMIPEEYITEEILAATMRAESALRKAISELLEENGIPCTQYNEGLGTFACWSMTHGVSQLAAMHINHAACLDGRWPPELMLNDYQQVLASFDMLTEILVNGLLSAAKK